MELILKLSICRYVELSWRISSPASIYHFLSMIVGPRFLSAGLITIIWLFFRSHNIALMFLLSCALSVWCVRVRLLDMSFWNRWTTPHRRQPPPATNNHSLPQTITPSRKLPLPFAGIHTLQQTTTPNAKYNFLPQTTTPAADYHSLPQTTPYGRQPLLPQTTTPFRR